MKRFALLALLVATAGCGRPIGGSPSASPTTSTSTCEPYRVTAGLELAVAENVTAHVTIESQSTEQVVLNRTYTGWTTVKYGDEQGVFEPATDYQVSIRVDGQVRWNKTVHRTERWDLRVHANGTVTKVNPVVVYDTPTAAC